jgi:hypothetical protein
LSYLVSVGAVSRIRGNFRPEMTGERRALWREAADGIRLVLRHPLLRAVLIQAPLLNFAFNGVFFTITVSLRQHGSAPAVIGLVQAGIAAGGLLGALAAAWLVRRLSMRLMVIGLNVAGTALFATAALVLPSPLVAVPVGAAMVLAPAANAALTAAGLLVQHFSGRWALAVFAAAIGIAAVLSVALTGFRVAEGT